MKKEFKDIVIYTRAEKLDGKIARPTNNITVSFWTLSSLPKHFSNDMEDGCKVYFAYKGRIAGYFLARESYFYAGKEIPKNAILLDPWSWTVVEYDKKLKCNAFQGFKYKWWKGKLKDLDGLR